MKLFAGFNLRPSRWFFCFPAALLFLAVSCSSPIATTAQAITVVAMETAAPQATATQQPTPTPPSLPESERVSVVEAYSFISPVGYATELDEFSAYLDHQDGEMYFLLTVIGAGQDERTAQGVLDGIFARFEGVTFEDRVSLTLDGLAAERTDFNGVLQPAVLSGTYIVTELPDGSSFLAFAMGNVTETNDSWLAYGEKDFGQLLKTIQIELAEN